MERAPVRLDVIFARPRLDAQLEEPVEAAASQSLEVSGCAHITAARFLAESAGIGRFRSNDAYAVYTGTAPIPASSG